MDAGLVALAEELRQAVGGFVRKVRRAADTPPAAWSDTLGELDRRGPMTVAALARLRQVRHQSMRVVVAQLEAEAMVVRAPDAADARGQVVEVTEAGRTALASSRAARTNWIAAGLQKHATARERQAVATALAVLRRLAAAPD
jgi:DNA-binding MarR family transcriptional regulator